MPGFMRRGRRLTPLEKYLKRRKRKCYLKSVRNRRATAKQAGSRCVKTGR